jgi:hypothetical protein
MGKHGVAFGELKACQALAESACSGPHCSFATLILLSAMS